VTNPVHVAVHVIVERVSDTGTSWSQSVEVHGGGPRVQSGADDVMVRFPVFCHSAHRAICAASSGCSAPPSHLTERGVRVEFLKEQSTFTGESKAALARSFGVSRETVCQYLRQLSNSIADPGRR
jgi:hypothetical protein